MLTSDLIGRYISTAERHDRTEDRGNVKSVRYLYKVHIPIWSRIEVTLIKRLVWRVVMQSPQVKTLEAKACQILRALFERHIKDDGYYLLPEDWRELFSPHQALEAQGRKVSNYISGMTDDHAEKLYSRLFLPKHGTVFDRM